MSKAGWFFGVVLLFCGVVASGFYLVRLVTQDIATYATDSIRNLHLGGRAIGEFKHERVDTRLHFSRSDGARGVIPGIGVEVKGVEVTVGDVTLQTDSVLFVYSFTGNSARVSFPGGAVKAVVKSYNSEVPGDQLQCNVGAGIVMEWHENVLLHNLKRVIFGKSGDVNDILQVQYIDNSGVSCANLVTGEVIPVYNKVLFGFSAIGKTGVKLDAEVSTLVDGSNKFLSLDIKDMFIHQYPEERRVDVDMSEFKFLSNDFSVSVGGSLSVFEKCIMASFRGCKVDALVEIQGYEKFFKLVSGGVIGAFGSDNGLNHAGILNVVDAVRKAIRNAAVYGESDDVVTLALKSRGGELAVGKMSLDQFTAEVLAHMNADENSGTEDITTFQAIAKD